MSEQRLEPGEMALLDGPEEPSCQIHALLGRRLETGPALVDVAAARVASWRTLSSLLPPIRAISGYR